MAVEEIPICRTTFKLNNGSSIPAVGLGTWQGVPGTSDASHLRDSIIHALRSGYRLIDTAQMYGVEPIVGDAIRASTIPRSEITLITKFPSQMHHDPAAALERSLTNLGPGIDHIDIFLMHWPCALSPDGKSPVPLDESRPTYVETWKKMEKLDPEKCKSIGVSNFTQKTLETLLKEASVIPVVNQVELHAMNPCLKLVPYCEEKGIRVISWSTLGSRQGLSQATAILSHPLFLSIAKNHHSCSPAVVSLSWAVQRGIVVIPKSGTPERIEENLRLVTLSDEEMETMNNAHRTVGKVRLSDYVPMKFDVPGKGETLLGWTKQDFGFEDEEGNWLV